MRQTAEEMPVRARARAGAEGQPSRRTEPARDCLRRLLCRICAWVQRPVEARRGVNFWIRRVCWIDKVIHDSDTFDDYESQRLLEVTHLIQKIISGLLYFQCATSLLVWMSGARPFVGAVVNIIPPVVNNRVAAATLPAIKNSSSHSFRRFCWIALHISVIVVNSFSRLAYASQEDGPHQLIFFHASFLAGLFLIACVGYTPGSDFYCICCPIVALLWVMGNVCAGVHLRPAVFSGVGIALVSAYARGAVDTVNQQNFSLTRELEKARAGLEHVLSAQQSVFSTIFDAAGACDVEGQIVQSTPQMLELLASGDLLRESFAGLAASPEEERRVQEFLRAVWRSGVGKASMIQARLRRGPDRGRDAPCGGSFEVSIVCVRLPGAGVAGRRVKLWEHDGLFLGLREVNGGFLAPPAAAADGGAPVGAGGATERSADGDRARTSRARGGAHELVFDAGTPTLDVIDCSAALSCAGLPGIVGGLLELLPARAAGRFDSWVYEEVQAAAVSHACRSRARLRQMTFDLPPSPGVRVQAHRAWLEFEGIEHYDADVPVRLVLSGLRACGGPPGGGLLEPIQEGGAPQEEALQAQERWAPQGSASEGGGVAESGAEGASVSSGSSVYTSASGQAAARVPFW